MTGREIGIAKRNAANYGGTAIWWMHSHRACTPSKAWDEAQGQEAYDHARRAAHEGRMALAALEASALTASSAAAQGQKPARPARSTGSSKARV